MKNINGPMVYMKENVAPNGARGPIDCERSALF